MTGIQGYDLMPVGIRSERKPSPGRMKYPRFETAPRCFSETVPETTMGIPFLGLQQSVPKLGKSVLDPGQSLEVNGFKLERNEKGHVTVRDAQGKVQLQVRSDNFLNASEALDGKGFVVAYTTPGAPHSTQWMRLNKDGAIERFQQFECRRWT